MPILSFLIFFPLLGALLILFSPKYHRLLAIATTVVHLMVTSWLWWQFDKTSAGYQFQEQADWLTLKLGSFGIISIDYSLGIDGLSMPLLWLTSLVMLVGVWVSGEITDKKKGFYALMLLLMSSIIGCFVALDLFLFFLFFEFMLLPMYFLIGLWGGPRREYAALKFFIYTLIGSVFILLVMLGLYLSVIDPAETAVMAGIIKNKALFNQETLQSVQLLIAQQEIDPAQLVHTFQLPYLADMGNYVPESFLNVQSGHELFGLPTRALAFLFLLIGFGIKLPVVPFHTWLPDAHVEAPTGVSVVLAGILLKVGGYGLFRVAFEIFPDGGLRFAELIGTVGVVSILYGAYNALAQSDLKRLVAYSSVSHMGFVLVGLASITSEGANGAIFQLFSHGILSAMLFVITGVFSSRTHDRNIGNYRGLAAKMPRLAVLTTVAFFASLGLPAFSGFIGEFFCLMGAFNSIQLPVWMVAGTGLGLVLGAGYFLWTLQRMFFGNYWSLHEEASLPDLTFTEQTVLWPLAVLAIYFGLQPQTLFSTTETYITAFMGLF